jgi:hypothetical protein
VGAVEVLVDDEATVDGMAVVVTADADDEGTEKEVGVGGTPTGNSGRPTEEGMYTAGGRIGSGGGGIIDGPTPGGYRVGIGGYGK